MLNQEPRAMTLTFSSDPGSIKQNTNKKQIDTFKSQENSNKSHWNFRVLHKYLSQPLFSVFLQVWTVVQNANSFCQQYLCSTQEETYQTVAILSVLMEDTFCWVVFGQSTPGATNEKNSLICKLGLVICTLSWLISSLLICAVRLLVCIVIWHLSCHWILTNTLSNVCYVKE